MRVAITGAGGFIGSRLVEALAGHCHQVRALSTGATSGCAAGVEQRRVHVSEAAIQWGDAIRGMEAVIHLAGRAHVMAEASADPLEEFRRVNVRATLQLAHQAIEEGVRRFIFVSSIGVNGSSTSGCAFTEAATPAPTEPYAVSKWEAEQGLRELEQRSKLELTIVRLPLVYGPRAKGNFARLLRLVRSGIPLPLASVRNLRSYAGLDNVCDFLELCLQHPSAAGQLFLLADGKDVSTPDLISAMAISMDRPSHLFSCPPSLLRAVAGLAGRRAEVDRLTGSLQVDATRARSKLNWTPPVSFDSGIAAMTQWYLEQGSR